MAARLLTALSARGPILCLTKSDIGYSGTVFDGKNPMVSSYLNQKPWHAAPALLRLMEGQELFGAKDEARKPIIVVGQPDLLAQLADHFFMLNPTKLGICNLLDHTIIDVAQQLRTAALVKAESSPEGISEIDEITPLRLSISKLVNILGLTEDVPLSRTLCEAFVLMRSKEGLTEAQLSEIIDTALFNPPDYSKLPKEGKATPRRIALDIEVMNPNHPVDSLLAVGMAAGPINEPIDTRFRVDVLYDGPIDNAWWESEEMKPILERIRENGVPLKEARRKMARFILDEFAKGGPLQIVTDYASFDYGVWITHLWQGFEDLYRANEISIDGPRCLTTSLSVADKDQMIRVLLGVKDSERWVSDDDLAKRMDFTKPEIPPGRKHEPDFDAAYIREFYDLMRPRISSCAV